jgi:hypothetical protein
LLSLLVVLEEVLQLAEDELGQVGANLRHRAAGYRASVPIGIGSRISNAKLRVCLWPEKANLREF